MLETKVVVVFFGHPALGQLLQIFNKQTVKIYHFEEFYKIDHPVSDQVPQICKKQTNKRNCFKRFKGVTSNDENLFQKP